MGEWVGWGVCKWAGWCVGGLIDVVGMGGWVGAEMVSSIVMYNFGGGPRGDPLFTAF